MVDVGGPAPRGSFTLRLVILNSVRIKLASPKEQTSNQHFSMVSASVPASGFLLLVFVLTFLQRQTVM